jgi:hypothetical protein
MASVPPNPKSRNAPARQIAWPRYLHRETVFGSSSAGLIIDKRIEEVWVFAPFGEWTIGYRIETDNGAPYVAEQRTWLTDSPPWKPRIRQKPTSAPDLDLARKTLSSRQAIREWRDNSERIGGDNRHPFQRHPRLTGFDPAAPSRSRPDDTYFAEIARRYAECRQGSLPYTRVFKDQLGVTQAQARKLVFACRERGLLDGGELTPYARGLLAAGS